MTERLPPPPRYSFDDLKNIRIDPEHIDEGVRALQKKLRRAVDNGRYTRVRLIYKGRPIMPDIPMGAFLASEVATFLLIGPLKGLVVNLGIKSFIEVEVIHEADELVQEGIELYLAGEVDEAEGRYREALDKKPDDTAALYNLGVLLRVTGRRAEAVQCFERAARDDEHTDGPRAKEALERMGANPRGL